MAQRYRGVYGSAGPAPAPAGGAALPFGVRSALIYLLGIATGLLLCSIRALPQGTPGGAASEAATRWGELQRAAERQLAALEKAAARLGGAGRAGAAASDASAAPRAAVSLRGAAGAAGAARTREQRSWSEAAAPTPQPTPPPPVPAGPCVRFEAALWCAPGGPKEPKLDKTCDERVPSGLAGNCVCGGTDGAPEKRFGFGCSHSGLDCREVCRDPPTPAPPVVITEPWHIRAHLGSREEREKAATSPPVERLGCVGWRETANCMPDSDRRPERDRPCTASISETRSGYCECSGGVQRGRTGCGHPRFTCEGICAGGGGAGGGGGPGGGAAEQDAAGDVGG
eukprot:TRINITY_DN10893_c1_g1_i2.p1 TRINITY_DN10893_c1_g1~~TRINITY_DN10893_c1_g1_i2.p1  ORF type:complete len:363 (+),score=43.05 TRINITY_DN10893_c1_g1_i2:69-1091(+)